MPKIRRDKVQSETLIARMLVEHNSCSVEHFERGLRLIAQQTPAGIHHQDGAKVWQMSCQFKHSVGARRISEWAKFLCDLAAGELGKPNL